MYVIGVAPLLCGSDVPADLPGRDGLYGGTRTGSAAAYYARPDVFRLVVDTRQQLTVQQDPAADGSPADHTAAARPRPDHGGANHAP